MGPKAHRRAGVAQPAAQTSNSQSRRKNTLEQRSPTAQGQTQPMTSKQSQPTSFTLVEAVSDAHSPKQEQTELQKAEVRDTLDCADNENTAVPPFYDAAQHLVDIGLPYKLDIGTSIQHAESNISGQTEAVPVCDELREADTPDPKPTVTETTEPRDVAEIINVQGGSHPETAIRSSDGKSLQADISTSDLKELRRGTSMILEGRSETIDSTKTVYLEKFGPLEITEIKEPETLITDLLNALQEEATQLMCDVDVHDESKLQDVESSATSIALRDYACARATEDQAQKTSDGKVACAKPEQISNSTVDESFQVFNGSAAGLSVDTQLWKYRDWALQRDTSVSELKAVSTPKQGNPLSNALNTPDMWQDSMSPILLSVDGQNVSLIRTTTQQQNIVNPNEGLFCLGEGKSTLNIEDSNPGVPSGDSARNETDLVQNTFESELDSVGNSRNNAFIRTDGTDDSTDFAVHIAEEDLMKLSQIHNQMKEPGSQSTISCETIFMGYGIKSSTLSCLRHMNRQPEQSMPSTEDEMMESCKPTNRALQEDMQKSSSLSSPVLAAECNITPVSFKSSPSKNFLVNRSSPSSMSMETDVLVNKPLDPSSLAVGVSILNASPSPSSPNMAELSMNESSAPLIPVLVDVFFSHPSPSSPIKKVGVLMSEPSALSSLTMGAEVQQNKSSALSSPVKESKGLVNGFSSLLSSIKEAEDNPSAVSNQAKETISMMAALIKYNKKPSTQSWPTAHNPLDESSSIKKTGTLVSEPSALLSLTMEAEDQQNKSSAPSSPVEESKEIVNGLSSLLTSIKEGEAKQSAASNQAKETTSMMAALVKCNNKPSAKSWPVVRNPLDESSSIKKAGMLVSEPSALSSETEEQNKSSAPSSLVAESKCFVNGFSSLVASIKEAKIKPSAASNKAKETISMMATLVNCSKKPSAQSWPVSQNPLDESSFIQGSTSTNRSHCLPAWPDKDAELPVNEQSPPPRQAKKAEVHLKEPSAAPPSPAKEAEVVEKEQSSPTSPFKHAELIVKEQCALQIPVKETKIVIKERSSQTTLVEEAEVVVKDPSAPPSLVKEAEVIAKEQSSAPSPVKEAEVVMKEQSLPPSPAKETQELVRKLTAPLSPGKETEVVVEAKVVLKVPSLPQIPVKEPDVVREQPSPPSPVKEPGEMGMEPSSPRNLAKEAEVVMREPSAPPSLVKEAEVIANEQTSVPSSVKEAEVLVKSQSSPPSPVKEPEVVRERSSPPSPIMEPEVIGMGPSSPPSPVKEPEVIGMKPFSPPSPVKEPEMIGMKPSSPPSPAKEAEVLVTELSTLPSPVMEAEIVAKAASSPSTPDEEAEVFLNKSPVPPSPPKETKVVMKEHSSKSSLVKETQVIVKEKSSAPIPVMEAKVVLKVQSSPPSPVKEPEVDVKEQSAPPSPVKEEEIIVRESAAPSSPAKEAEVILKESDVPPSPATGADVFLKEQSSAALNPLKEAGVVLKDQSAPSSFVKEVEVLLKVPSTAPPSPGEELEVVANGSSSTENDSDGSPYDVMYDNLDSSSSSAGDCDPSSPELLFGDAEDSSAEANTTGPLDLRFYGGSYLDSVKRTLSRLSSSFESLLGRRSPQIILSDDAGDGSICSAKESDTKGRSECNDPADLSFMDAMDVESNSKEEPSDSSEVEDNETSIADGSTLQVESRSWEAGNIADSTPNNAGDHVGTNQISTKDLEKRMEVIAGRFQRMESQIQKFSTSPIVTVPKKRRVQPVTINLDSDEEDLDHVDVSKVTKTISLSDSLSDTESKTKFDDEREIPALSQLELQGRSDNRSVSFSEEVVLLDEDYVVSDLQDDLQKPKYAPTPFRPFPPIGGKNVSTLPVSAAPDVEDPDILVTRPTPTNKMLSAVRNRPPTPSPKKGYILMRSTREDSFARRDLLNETFTDEDDDAVDNVPVSSCNEVCYSPILDDLD